MRFTFRPLTADDLPALVRWQASDAAAPWFRTQTAEEAAVRYADRLAGTAAVRMIVVSLGGRDLGYAQLYRIGDLPTDDFVPADANDVGIDYCLGEPDAVGRGLGSQLIADLVEFAAWLYPSAGGVVACPDHRNRPSIRVLEKNGFVEGLWFDKPGPQGVVVTEVAYRRRLTRS